MTKTSHDIKNDIAKRDAEAQSIRELLSAGYAATSGQVVNEAEERRKAHQADIRKRIDAGEHVSSYDLLSYGYSQIDTQREVVESETVQKVNPNEQ